MFADRGPRLVNLAYFGHMWELYALWTWLPAFLAASSTAPAGLPPAAGTGASGIDAFLAIGVAGLVGCLIGGSGRGPRGPCRHRRRGAGYQRRLLPALTAVLHRQPPLAARLRVDLGGRRHRRLRRVLDAAERAGRPPLPRHRADRPDRDRIPADHRHHPAIPLIAGAVGWRYAFLALAAGPLTALAALTSLHRTMRAERAVRITITGRTTP